MRLVGLKSAKAAVVSAVVFLATMTAMAQPAGADTPPGQVAHVYMNLDNRSGNSAAAGYSAFINSLRSAAGHAFRGGTYIAQSNPGGIIRADINATGGTRPLGMTLWIDPQNLYVLGFTNANNQTLYFDDLSPADVDRVAGGALAEGFHGGFQRLPFGGNYMSLSAAAGRGRDAMPISMNDIYSSVANLATTNSGNIGTSTLFASRSLMLLIQVTSEAARFNNVYGIMSQALGTPVTRNSLPSQEQNLENNWAAMSGFGVSVSNNSTTRPVTIVGAGAPDGDGHPTNLVLHSWSDVARYVGTLLGNLANVGGPGHTEL
ncbi:ribosome-inactivating family protein [Streptacidiphilus sp. P02-A3a]|uniref:ribosome-inactivating family protein n=1 Tax=Streptacidiphilus sp. P02-A3a TaxID=2704468 RepID=UPI0015FCBCEA|nr:ribosome-inactivating family protein [Streptacidiphilus sp. P02-A3a]QMU69805.1 hypothetical protein GXP74_17710 [Streptacidiphilus sp. P02-A3a]